MSTKFYVPKRYDDTVADEGQWFSVYDTDDTLYGEFKLKFLDAHKKEGELAYKRVRSKYATEIRTKKLGAYDSLKVVLVELHMVDWKLPTNPDDAKAKPIPFSIENALEYFSMDETKWIAHQLSEYASDASNFKGGEQPTAEEVAGN